MIRKTPETTGRGSHRGKDANTFFLPTISKIVNLSGLLGDVLLLTALVALEVLNG